MKLRHLLLGAGLTGAALLVLFDQPSIAPVVQPTARTATSPQTNTTATIPHTAATKPVTHVAAITTHSGPAVLQLIDRQKLIGAAAVGRSRDPMASTLFTSKAIVATPALPAKPAALSLPTAPPLPFAYVGKQLQEGQLQVFVAHGEVTRVIKASDVIDETYRVDSINGKSMTLTYLPLGQTQTLALE
jgi:hypothetical protein